MIHIKIINKSNNKLPKYETLGAAAMDIHASLDVAIILQPMERALVPTGLYIELPHGHEAQIRTRSGLAIKYGITCLNSPGTIDSDYRGEIKVILINLGNEPYTIHNGDRIAQMVIHQYTQAEWELVTTLSPTSRSEAGFGSTGKS